ncbi:hypothetical protein BHM03_00036434, partial [Ensete ventricosum]
MATKCRGLGGPLTARATGWGRRCPARGGRVRKWVQWQRNVGGWRAYAGGPHGLAYVGED